MTELLGGDLGGDGECDGGKHDYGGFVQLTVKLSDLIRGLLDIIRTDTLQSSPLCRSD